MSIDGDNVEGLIKPGKERDFGSPKPVNPRSETSETELHQELSDTHKAIHGFVNDTLQKRNLSQYHRDELEGVMHNLHEAGSHLTLAKQNNLGKWNVTDDAKGHVAAAHNKLTRAHNLLMQSDAFAAHKDSIHTSHQVPDVGHMARLGTKVAGMSRLGAGGEAGATKPHNHINLGGIVLKHNPETGDYRTPSGEAITEGHLPMLENKFGKDHPGVQKLRQGFAGVKRTRQYDPTKKSGSPTVGKGQGYATEEEKEAGQATDRQGKTKPVVDPRKRGSQKSVSARWEMPSSRIGKPRGMQPGIPPKKRGNG